MQLLTVVVAHADSVAAQQLSNSLRAHFRKVSVANDEPGLREAIEHSRAHLAIIDLDVVPLEQIKEICSDYSATGVVCVHRAPDYELWNAAMNAGALECCHPTDIPSILNAMRSRPVAKARSAAA
jgi:DNA-binding NarL/FixJ family response regulator